MGVIPSVIYKKKGDVVFQFYEGVILVCIDKDGSPFESIFNIRVMVIIKVKP